MGGKNSTFPSFVWSVTTPTTAVINEMTHAIPLKVPILVEAGDNWLEAH